MIVLENNFKVFDRIFFYPLSTPDIAIENDATRKLLSKVVDYPSLINRKDVVVIYPWGSKERDLKTILDKYKDRNILWINCGENIFGKHSLIFHAYFVLRHLGFSIERIERILFNKVCLNLFSIPSFFQQNKFFKELVRRENRFHFILTNSINRKNAFHAPYFYVFCRDRIERILNHSSDNSVRRKFCAFIVSNPANTDRIKFFKKLAKYKKVDSLGKVLNTVKLAETNDDHVVSNVNENDALLRQYKFAICFENSYAPGYVTEKIVNAIAGGAIPIYRGAPDVGLYFNTKRMINYDDFGSYEAMINEVVRLDSDDGYYHAFVAQQVFANDIRQQLRLHDENLGRFLRKSLSSADV